MGDSSVLSRGDPETAIPRKGLVRQNFHLASGVLAGESRLWIAL